MKKKYKVKIGGMWEFPDWEIHYDYEYSSYGGSKPCKHCSPLPFKAGKRSDGSVYNTGEKRWLCPMVIVMKNEGGYNSTGLCADCAYEVLDKLLK